MKRIKEHRIMAAIAIFFIGIAVTHHVWPRADAQTTNGPAATQDALQAFAMSNPVPVMQMDPNGWWTPRMDFAAHVWHTGTDVPNRPDGLIDPVTGKRVLRWPIVAVPKSGNPIIIWFGKDDPKDEDEKGRFRSSNWSIWTAPERWAYLRMGQEVWNESQKRMVVPGFEEPTPPVTDPATDPSKPLPKSLRYGVDSLKIRYTTGDILRAIDESPFNEPSEGAPEEGGAAPL